MTADQTARCDRFQSENQSTDPCEDAHLKQSALTIEGAAALHVHDTVRQTHSGFDSSTQLLPSCAVTLHHAFPRFASENDTLLDSLVRGTNVDISTSLWPKQRCSLGLGRQLTFLDRTRPFYCYLSTTFRNSAPATSSAIALRIERPIDDDAFLYYQFRSSDSDSELHALRIATQPYFGVNLFGTEPAAEIGYCFGSNQVRRQGLDCQPSLQLIPNRQKSSFDANNVFGQVGCAATPFLTCLFAKCVYHMFPGEGITPSAVPDEEVQGTKIEMAVYAHQTLTCAGLIRVVRKVGKCSVGVGVAGNSVGIFVTFSVRQWGQDLHLPVLIMPHDVLDNTFTLLAFGVPCVVCILEHAVGRRRKRRAKQGYGELIPIRT